MGMLDNIRNFFRGKENAPSAQRNDSYEKSMLADKIVDSVNKIKRINSFDSSIWNLSNVSTYDLQRRSLVELQKIQNTLNNRLAELTRQNQRGNSTMESLEASKWTGQKMQGMTDHDFDRFQDDGR